VSSIQSTTTRLFYFIAHTSHWGTILGILILMCGQIQLRKSDEAQANISLIILIIIALAGPNHAIYILGFITVMRIRSPTLTYSLAN